MQANLRNAKIEFFLSTYKNLFAQNYFAGSNIGKIWAKASHKVLGTGLLCAVSIYLYD